MLNMNVLLPSEIARLVLGYLTSVKCTTAREKFLEECPHLREYVFYLGNGHEYPTNISGYDLIHYLNIGFQYTQFITCGESIKFPLPTAASYFGFQNRAFAPGSTGQESPAQTGAGPSGTPLTSPRTNPPPYRTPRTAWANASPATDRRSPAESIIDVTTVTEPPSSEPQIPPPKRLSEVAIQTEDVDSQDGLPPPLTARGEGTAPVLPLQLTPRQPQTELVEPQSQLVPRLQILQNSIPHSLQPKTQSFTQQHQSLQTPSESLRPQLQPIQSQIQELEPQITEGLQQTPLTERRGQISNLVSNNLQLVPAHEFAMPNVPTSTPQPGSRLQQPLRKDGQMELSIGFPQIFSPKRKPSAPKRRSLGTPLDMFASPPSLDPSSTRKAIDELVQTQLAEKIAESINEVTVMRAPPPAEDTCPSLLSCGSNLPDNVLSDVISKTLSDPIMEELAQYMVIQSSAIDLETPTGTPLKGSALKTPFKQIAEDMARQGTSGSADFGQAGQTHMHNSSTDSQSYLSSNFSVNQVILGVNPPQMTSVSETMKIVVDSSVQKNPPRSSMLRSLPAPRKPSPKLSPPGSTNSTILDERTAESESAKSNKSTTGSATSFSMSQIKPIPGTHIRALDFGAASTKQGPSTETEKPRPFRNRKRKSPGVSVDLAPKPKRTSSRNRCSPASMAEIAAPTSQTGSTAVRPGSSSAVITAVTSATTYTVSTSSNNGQAGPPTVILSIPDDPQPKLSSSSPRKTRQPAIGSQRRQAILVEAVPPSRKTTPKRVASSRAKPRSRVSLASQVAQNGKSSTVTVTDFVMPSTPKKIPGPSASSIRANGRVIKSRNITIVPSVYNHDSLPETTAPPMGNTSTPLVTAPTNSEFNFDISALLDKVHKN